MKYLLLATCLMALNFCMGQQLDTIRVEMLVTDTSHLSYNEIIGVSCKEVKCKESINWHNHSHYKEVLVDKGRSDRALSYSISGYAVREKHNTAEDAIDPGGMTCVDKSGNIVSCFNDYYVHKGYLDKNKQPLPKTIIVWQAK